MTWWARWFGRRSKAAEELEDEPARFTAAAVAAVAKEPAQPTRIPTVTPPKAIPAAKAAKGFDPYNSGAFERRNAWERVSRR